MVDTQARIALTGAAPVFPEGVDAFLRMNMADGVGPALGEEIGIRLSGLPAGTARRRASVTVRRRPIPSAWSVCHGPPASSAAWLRTATCRRLGFPLIDAGIADAVPAAKLRDRRARLVLLQNPDVLFVCETIALHSLVLSMGQSLLQNGLFQRGKVTSRASTARLRSPGCRAPPTAGSVMLTSSRWCSIRAP